MKLEKGYLSITSYIVGTLTGKKDMHDAPQGWPIDQEDKVKKMDNGGLQLHPGHQSCQCLDSLCSEQCHGPKEDGLI